MLCSGLGRPGAWCCGSWLGLELVERDEVVFDVVEPGCAVGWSLAGLAADVGDPVGHGVLGVVLEGDPALPQGRHLSGDVSHLEG